MPSVMARRSRAAADDEQEGGAVGEAPQYRRLSSPAGTTACRWRPAHSLTMLSGSCRHEEVGAAGAGEPPHGQRNTHFQRPRAAAPGRLARIRSRPSSASDLARARRDSGWQAGYARSTTVLAEASTIDRAWSTLLQR